MNFGDLLQTTIFVPEEQLGDAMTFLGRAGYDPRQHGKSAVRRTTSGEVRGRFLDLTVRDDPESHTDLQTMLGESNLGSLNNDLIFQPFCREVPTGEVLARSVLERTG